MQKELTREASIMGLVVVDFLDMVINNIFLVPCRFASLSNSDQQYVLIILEKLNRLSAKCDYGMETSSVRYLSIIIRPT